MPHAVSVDRVTRWFPASHDGRYTAIADVTLNVDAGRFVSVVGPSGCGKSTLLNIVAGLMGPSAGDVTIFGEPLRGINRRAAYLFQQDALLPWKTVLDNVELGLEFRGVAKAEARALAMMWVKRVGLEEFARRYPYQLSGGMRRRAAMAQVWIVDPDLLLMDEPFSSLDIHTRQRMEEELLNLWAGSSKTVLFVTHDLEEAIALSDEVVLLSAGPASGVVGAYPIDLPRPRHLMDLKTDPKFVELYRALWSDLRQEVVKSHARSAG